MKQKIKRLFKSIQLIIDYKLGNSFIYYYQKILLKLTFVLVVAVFVVIKGCIAPLLIDNKIMRFFFYSNGNGDKTLYNIGISVIAAYIFYLVQVHIPEKTRCKKMMGTVSRGNIHQIFILEQFIKAWNVFLGCKNNIYFCQFKEFEYTTNHGKHSLTKMLYEETVEELTDNIERLFAQTKFNDCDSSYQEFLASLYDNLYGFKRYLLDVLPLWSDDPLELPECEYTQIKNKIREFSKFSKKLQSIEKYMYIVEDGTSPHKGNGTLQEFAKKL